jgi:hypothetical protein
MNKGLVGTLQEIIALAESAQETDDFEALEIFTVAIADRVNELGLRINKLRPSTGISLMDQYAVSKFNLSLIPRRYRPVSNV